MWEAWPRKWPTPREVEMPEFPSKTPDKEIQGSDKWTYHSGSTTKGQKTYCDHVPWESCLPTEKDIVKERNSGGMSSSPPHILGDMEGFQLRGKPRVRKSSAAGLV